MPAVSTWIGSLSNPQARTSQDCRNAALAMEKAAASVSALWSGTYRGTRGNFDSDVWPGDHLLLQAPSTNLDAQVIVRSVKLTIGQVIRISSSTQSLLPTTGRMTWQFTPAPQFLIDAWLPAPIAPFSLTISAGSR